MQLGVIHSAKIRIFRQITTVVVTYTHFIGCDSQCKDKNFQTNHNVGIYRNIPYGGVIHSAKIRIFRQITTLRWRRCMVMRCDSQCKDKNFQTNHNNAILRRAAKKGVIHSAKIRIFRQITTCN